MTRRYRTALVGAGRIGARFADDPVVKTHIRYATHAEVLAEHPAFSWEAVVDPDPAATDWVHARWGVPIAASSIAELLTTYQPEVLVLATPPHDRQALVSQCSALKAVLCEKPLASTLADADAFLNECERRAILVQVNFWRRGDQLFRQLASRGLPEIIGNPQGACGFYGNGLLNNGAHLIDFCRMLLGEVVAAEALGEPIRRAALPLVDDFDVACALWLENGTAVVLQPLDFAHYREVGLDIWGERGRLQILDEGLTIVVSPRRQHRALSDAYEVASDECTLLTPTVSDALWQIYNNLSLALDGKAALLSPGREALRTTLIADAVRRSALAFGPKASRTRFDSFR